jgi:large subunit ribosomal protein L4
MQVDVLSITGSKTGRSIDLPDNIFGAEPNNHVIYLAVKQYLAAQRQGTHKVKTRAEVKGASRKLHKQKGTGGARKGNIRNPLYKGGGTIFGPKSHKYDIKLNRQVKDLARIGALSHKGKSNAIVVVEDLQLETPKTSTFAGMLKGLNISNKKALYVTPELNEQVFVSARNIPSVLTTVLLDINTYDVMNADVLVLTESAAKVFSEQVEDAEA